MISIALYSWKPSECLTQLKMAGFSGLLLCFLCDTAVFMCHIVSAKFYRMLIGRWGEKEKDFQWWWREVLNSVNLWKQFRNPRVLRLDLRTSGQYPGESMSTVRIKLSHLGTGGVCDSKHKYQELDLSFYI